MINHDYVFKNVEISQNCIADTDVTVLKYTRETFMVVVNAFTDIYEDMRQVVADKVTHQHNAELLKKAIAGEETRSLIINHYNDIIQDEQRQYRKTNKSLAMKLNTDKSRRVQGDGANPKEGRKKAAGLAHGE